jgi:hypothetical protein
MTIAAHSNAAMESRGEPSADHSIGPDDALRVDAWDFYKTQEPYLSRNIQLADAKAGVVALAVAGAFTFLLKEGAIHKPFFNVLHMGNSSGISLLIMGFAAVALVSLMGGAFFAFFTIVPRILLNGLPRIENIGTPNVVSWPDIAKFPRAQGAIDGYAASFHALSKSEMDGQLLNAIHALASVCRRKMQSLKISLWCSAIGFVSALIYLILESST